MLRPSRSRLLSAAGLLLAASLFAAPAFAVFGDDDSSRDGDAAPTLKAIVVEGNNRTDTTLILREMNLQVGEPFAYDEMDAVWDHLEDVGYFAFVDMEYDDSEPDSVTLRVMVEEDMTTEYGPLVRYDRRHKYRLGARLKERNFRGKGETIDVALSVYYLQRADLSWQRPWFLGVDGLDLTVAGDFEMANFVFRPTRYKKWDVGCDLRWSFADPFYVEGGAAYGQFNQRDEFTWANPDRGEGAAGVTVYPSGTSTHWVFDGAVGLDTRDNRWYPRSGQLLDLRVRRWESGDFEPYTEFLGDLRLFVPIPVAQHRLAMRAWSRTTDGPSQLDNALYLGGPEDFRGYAFGQTEGDEAWLATVEYRIPLFLMPISPSGEMIGLGLHLFADAGDAWYHGAKAGRPNQDFGGGVHINLDTLQLRFEAAKPREGDWKFIFYDKFAF